MALIRTGGSFNNARNRVTVKKKVIPTKNPSKAPPLIEDKITGAANDIAAKQDKLNNYNIEGPTGSQEWITNPDGTKTLKVKMSEGEKSLYDNRINQQGNLNTLIGKVSGSLGDTLSKSVDFSGIKTQLPTDMTQFRQGVADRLYGGYTRRLGDRVAQERNALQQEMADKGIVPSNKQYDALSAQKEQAINDAYQGAATSAEEMAGQESARTFGQALQGRQQEISEYMAPRQQGIAELQGLMGMTKDPSMPEAKIPNPVDYGNIVGNLYTAEVNKKLKEKEMALQERLARLAASRSGGGGRGGGGGEAASDADMAEIYKIMAEINSITSGGGGGGSAGNAAINGAINGVTAGVVNSLYR